MQNNVLSQTPASRFTIRVLPFTHQRLGLLHELAHCVIPHWGQLLILRYSHWWGVYIYIYIYMLRALLSNELVGCACGQARSSDPRGRAYRPNGKGNGEEGVLSDVVSELFILPGLKSVFLWASNPDMHGGMPPATQHTSRRWPGPDRRLQTGPIGSPPTCSPVPSVITD